jgi:hypothetical protein
VASELVPDLLNGLVAAGTLALAVRARALGHLSRTWRRNPPTIQSPDRPEVEAVPLAQARAVADPLTVRVEVRRELLKIILDTGNIASAVRFLTGLSSPGCKGVTWRDKDNSAHSATPVRLFGVELSPAEEKAVGSALGNIRRSEAFRSADRFSTVELLEQLAAYARERRDAGRADKTVDLDRRKVEYFLHWLDTGELPGSH